MNHPFNIALAEEKKYEVRVRLVQKYPRLPVEIIQTAIDTCTWYTLFQGTNRYNTQIALDTFAEMASNVVEERREQSNNVIEMILLEHKKSAGSRKRVGKWNPKYSTRTIAIDPQVGSQHLE